MLLSFIVKHFVMSDLERSSTNKLYITVSILFVLIDINLKSWKEMVIGENGIVELKQTERGHCDINDMQ